jgi:hypothetical protein
MPDLLSPASFMVGNAPNAPNYAAPLIGFQLGDRLANLPNQYFQGTQQARTLALQNAFPNGLPRDPKTGGIDIQSTMDTLTKLGGAEFAQQNIQFLMMGQMGAGGAAAIEGGDDAAPSMSAPTSPAPVSNGGPGNTNAAGVAHIMGSRGTAAAAGPQPDIGDQNTGANTIRGVATETFGPDRDVSAQLPRYAATLGVKVDDPLTPQQVTQARNLMAPRVAQAGPSNVSAITGGGAPVTPLSGASGAAAPPSGNPPETAAPASGIRPSVQPSQAQQTLQVPGVPAGYDPGAYGNALLKRAQGEHAQAARYAAFPGGQAMSQSLENDAKAKEERAKQIFDFMGTAAQPTTEQKNISSGATQKGEELKNEITQSQKTYNGMQAASAQYERELKPNLDLERSILNDPSMVTGFGANQALDFNKVRAQLGDQKAAMLQEALSKITATAALGMINQQKDQMLEAGPSSGRIFSQQVDLVMKAAPSLSTTLAGNRFRLEVLSRIGDLSMQVAQQARDYITAHGHLDANFDGQISSYLKAYPLFTKQELSHPELFGAPTARPDMTNGNQIIAWGKSMGLKSGDAMRMPDGRTIKQMP